MLRHLGWRTALPVALWISLRGWSVHRSIRSTATGGLRVGLGIFGRLFGLRECLVEALLVQARIIERVAPAPVRQRQFGRHPDVLLLDGDLPRRFARPVPTPTPGRVRHRRAREHQVSPHAIHVERRAQGSDTA